jgi:hypothetical protein
MPLFQQNDSILFLELTSSDLYTRMDSPAMVWLHSACPYSRTLLKCLSWRYVYKEVYLVFLTTLKNTMWSFHPQEVSVCSIFIELRLCNRRSQWPRGLRYELFSPVQTLGSWVRIPQRHGCLCLRLFCVYVVLCADSGLATGWSTVQGVLPTVYKTTKVKKATRAQQRAVEPLMK